MDLGYLSLVLCNAKVDAVGMRFPQLLRALRDFLTTSSGTAAPMTEFSKVCCAEVLTASTVTVDDQNGEYVVFSCPPTFQGTKQPEVVRGALASLVGDIVGDVGMAKLLNLVSQVNKTKRAKPQVPKLALHHAGIGRSMVRIIAHHAEGSKLTQASLNSQASRLNRFNPGVWQVTETDADAWANELRAIIQSTLGRSLAKLISRWSSKMDWAETLLADSPFFETCTLAPDCHLARKLRAVVEPISLQRVRSSPPHSVRVKDGTGNSVHQRC